MTQRINNTTGKLATILAGVCLSSSAFCAAPNIPAFPGAVGFGANATGGRGGTVIHVTNLDDAGPGSFRDAVSQGHRIVVFDVGGTITVKSVVPIHSDITIAGQTAPGDGICVMGEAMSLSDQTNVIIRYMRFRQGLTSSRGKSTLGIHAGSNMIFDHVSVEWGRWDCVDMNESKDVTFQNCIIGEGINPQRFGCLCGSDNITFTHNLWINNQSRNPKAKGHVQYINNVVYNWGAASGFVGGHSLAKHYVDIINNYFVSGPSSGVHFVGGFTETDQVYQSGNFIDDNKDGKLNRRAFEQRDYTDAQGSPTFVTTAFFTPTVPTPIESADQAYAHVVADAGCSRPWDAIDQRLMGYVNSLGTQGSVIEDPVTVGGPSTLKSGSSELDTDHDGMPDAWEIAHKLNPHDATDANSDFEHHGYTNIETYINSIERPK